MAQTQSDPTLLLRADATFETGAGHVSRCLGVAEAWTACGGRVVLVGHISIGWLRRRVLDSGVTLLDFDGAPGSAADIAATAEVAAARRPQWMVVDGYQFDSNYQASIHRGDSQLAVIDDMGDLGPYQGRLVVNHSTHANTLHYETVDPVCRLLLGPRWALLGSRFWSLGRRRQPREVQTVLVTLGGGATAISNQDVAAGIRGSGLDVVVPTSAEHLYELMSRVDVAVSAAGTTAWELLACGVPTVVVPVAPNQIPVGRSIGAHRAAIWVEEVDDLMRIKSAVEMLSNDPDKRADLAARGQDLVDGSGALRTVRVMRQHGFWLKAVCDGDEETPRDRSSGPDPVSTTRRDWPRYAVLDGNDKELGRVGTGRPPTGGEGDLKMLGLNVSEARELECLIRYRTRFDAKRNRPGVPRGNGRQPDWVSSEA